MIAMIIRLCKECGVRCWHNPRRPAKKGEEQQYRCTYCGLPPQGNTNSDKKPMQAANGERQIARAKLLKITESGVLR